MSTVSLRTYINDLHNLDRRMSEFMRTARVIRHSGESFEARTVLDYANESGKALRTFEKHLARVTKEVHAIIGESSNGSPAQNLIERFDPRERYLVPHLKGELTKAHKEFRTLVRETMHLARGADRRLNDFGRYGSAAADSPLNILLDAGFGVLDLVAKILKRYKHPLFDLKR